jgi:LytS/YehU family sensor histidine kinase
MEEEPAQARVFNDSLADVYRYILQGKSKDLILLREEIIFLKDYFSLLNIRFGEAINLNIQVDDLAFDQYLVPPISLQILVENAIKHNEFSLGVPLDISIYIRDESIVVENMIRRKSLARPSSKIGLQNLSERYKLITNRSVAIIENESKFQVILPLLKLEL